MGGWFLTHLRSYSVLVVLHQWALLAGGTAENNEAITSNEAVGPRSSSNASYLQGRK